MTTHESNGFVLMSGPIIWVVCRYCFARTCDTWGGSWLKAATWARSAELGATLVHHTHSESIMYLLVDAPSPFPCR